MRSLEWNSENKSLRAIDQRLIPAQLAYVDLGDVAAVAEAIRTMVVRGAPAIGVAAGYGVALAAWETKLSDINAYKEKVFQAISDLRQSRPTAINLTFALDRMGKVLEDEKLSTDQLRIRLEEEAIKIDQENTADCFAISQYGAELIQDGDTIIHHCNTGGLATVEWGTALGAIHMAYQQGKRIHVLVDETRPRLQGARITAWELQQFGIPFDIITDNSAGYFLSKGKVDKVFFGADRVARNGDVANKVGTYMLALAAFHNKVPVYSIFPISSVDFQLPDGEAIPIEERDPLEVLDIQQHGEPVVPHGSTALNPAFDVTPHELITGWVTEKGMINPPFEQNISKITSLSRS
jgi:methylthioribose-1-phosphate isomerase